MQEKLFAGAVLIITVLLCIGMPAISNKLKPDTPFTQEFAMGIVEEVLEEDLSPDPIVQGKFRGTQKLLVKILEGNYKNKEFEVYNTLSSLHSNFAYKGLKAVFTLRESGGKTAVWLYNLKRDSHVFVLVGLFFAALVILGRGQGLKSALGLVFTCVLIVTVLIPALFAGFPPVPVSIGLVSVMTIVSFILISGFTRKTYTAIAGTVSGITIAGIISVIVSYSAQLSGVNMEGGEQLLNLAPDYNLQLDGLLVHLNFNCLARRCDGCQYVHRIFYAGNFIRQSAPQQKRTVSVGTNCRKRYYRHDEQHTHFGLCRIVPAARDDDLGLRHELYAVYQYPAHCYRNYARYFG